LIWLNFRRGSHPKMLILWNENLACLAVPKTGTTAIEAALAPFAAIRFERPPQAKHMTHKRFNRFIRPYLEMEGFENIETFAIMREPISWLGSWYRYRLRDDLIGTANSTSGLSFDDFVAACCLPHDERPPFARIGAQSRMLAGNPKRPRVDHLFRYDAMDQALAFLAERIGASLTLDRRNVSTAAPMEITASTKKAYEEAASADFDLYHSIA